MLLSVIQLILVLLAIPLFTLISIKYGWSKTLWTALDKKFIINHKNTLYILVFTAFDALMISLCIFVGLDYKFLNSILIGICFAFMPPLAKISN